LITKFRFYGQTKYCTFAEIKSQTQNPMKQIFSIVIILVLYSNKLMLAQDVIKSPIVGNDKDKHGCIGSAGYIWSVLKKECVRTFELKHTDENAIELISIDNTQKMVVLFSSNKTKAEVFYSGGNKVVNKSKKGNVYMLKDKKTIVEKLMNLKGSWQFVKVNNGESEVLYQ
jgi:hypothetical protein